MVRNILLYFLLSPFLSFGQLPDTLNQVNREGIKTGWWKSPIFWQNGSGAVANSAKLQYFQNGILLHAMYYIDGELQESSFANKKKRILIENFYEHNKMYNEIIALWKDTTVNYPYDSDIGNIYQGLANEFSRSYFDTTVNYRCLSNKQYRIWKHIKKYGKSQPDWVSYYYKNGIFQYGEFDFLPDKKHDQTRTIRIPSPLEGYSTMDNYDIPPEVFRVYILPEQNNSEK